MSNSQTSRLEEEIRELREDRERFMKELAEGRCRFNCRTRKEMFIEGFLYASDPSDTVTPVPVGWEQAVKERAEEGWKQYVQKNRSKS